MKIPMTRWVERWNAYWFPETSTLYLSISRIVIVATQLFWLSRPLALHLNLIEKNREFIDPQFLMSAVAAVLPSDVFFTRSAFTAFYWVIAVAGFAALIGMSKLVLGGPQWLNGYTLQSHTFWDAINRDIPLGIWLGQQHALAIVLSVFTVLLETFFVVSLLVPRTAPFIFIAAFFFQLGLLLTAGHVFYQHMVLLVLLLLFIRPEWWRSWWDKHVGRAATAEPAHPAAMSPG